jgi:hypothetical protein
MDSLTPRFAVEAHLRTLFADEEAVPRQETGEKAAPQVAPPLLPVLLPEGVRDDLASTNAARHDWIAQAGRPEREVTHGSYQRAADFQVSTTDPDATPMRRKGGGLHLGYHAHGVVDGGKQRVIMAALVTPAEVMENQPFLDLLWHVCFRWQHWPAQVTGDTTYGTVENITAVEDAGIRAYLPLPDFDQRTPYFGKHRFTYDAQRDVYLCPQGTVLTFQHPKHTEHVLLYQADAATCNACPIKAQCTESQQGRQVRRDIHEAYLDRVRAYHETEPYKKAMRKRQVWVEPLFAEAKDWHGLRRFRLRGLEKVNGEALLIAAGLNLKRLLSRRGWGRRPWPSGAPGLVLSSLAGCLLSLIQVLLAALKRRGPRPRHTLTHVRDLAA